MKRLNLWLRELSLTQQLMAIIFLFLAIFSILLVTCLSPMLDSLSQTEMFHLLHNSQDSIIEYIDSHDGEDLSGIATTNNLITQGVYEDGEFDMVGDGEFDEKLKEDVIERSESVTSGTQDFTFSYEKSSGEEVTYLYSMTPLSSGGVLISVIDNNYRAQFHASLVEQVVSMNVLIVFILFIILMIWVSTLIVPLNQIKAYITKLKKDEPAELNVNRRDAIGEVADALRDMDAELKKQSREKQEMIQNISHDLKTPIATIKSYGESIKDGVYPYDTLEKSVDVIIEHADRLEKKVQSLIILNKMDYLKDDIDPDVSVDMNEIIDKVILSLKVVRPEITLNKEAEPGVRFHGTEEPWRIVIENLIDNGLRYALSHITVTLKENELCVINDGSPIREEDLERIFHPYEKGTNGKFGLGLSIVYKVCTTYGYQVDAENLPGEVCFRVWKDEKKHKRNSRRTKGKETKEIAAHEA
jgi:two-component system sensor histidine kinase CssS